MISTYGIGEIVGLYIFVILRVEKVKGRNVLVSVELNATAVGDFNLQNDERNATVVEARRKILDGLKYTWNKK